ncbi:unnamed protein product [Clavelina lepadiformis]|uniref:Rad50/SbcC-type AAA domain-containing protein n=1 Tax=Clavelina lepadiformis TaxID=159417 RepID=A0ABP0G4J3_CLALP
MAMIEKLSIRGIRSFGDEVEEVMEFQRPLTLLVGPNGAGKTTIIESLKYVTIGKKPCSKNKDFIHDPKLKETKQVSANVKLRCRDVDGASLEVERYVTAEERGKKYQAQITDMRLYRDGKSVPCRRSADLDQEMVTSLGVSEAILNHVVFCHQEDSTWPLGKDTELKEKFDKIFEATRYMKALEEIRKVEKSQKEEADRESTELKFLDKNRKKRKEIADKLEKVEDEAKAERISLKTIFAKIGPVESKLNELSEKSDDVCKIEEKLTSLETQTQEKSKRINQLQRGIKKELKKGHDELLKLKIDAVKNLKSKQKERKMQEKELEHHCLKIREINAAFSTISAKLGKLEQKKEQAKEIMQNRDKRIKRYATEYNIQAPGSQISESEASQFELKFKSFVANYIEDLETEKNETENKFESVESHFLSQSYEAVKLEEGIAQKKENLKEYKSSLAKVQNDLDSLESTSNTKELEAAHQEFEEAQKELKKFETKNLIEKEKKFLLTLETEKTKIKGKIATQDDALNKAVKNICVRSKLEFISNYLKEKEMLVKSKKKFQNSVVVQALHKEDTEIIKNESRKLRDKLSEPTTSVDSILKERKNLLQRYYDVEETMNEIRDSIAANQESFFKLKEHVTTSWEKKIKLSLGTVDYNRLKDEEKVLEESVSSLSSRIQLDQATLSTLKTKVNKLKKEKQKATKEREAIIRKLNVQEQQLKLKQENLSASVKNVKEVLKEKLDKRMKDLNELTQTRRESLEIALEKKEEFENKIKSFNQDIANFDVDKRNIEDNLNICEISKEIENIKAEMKQKNKQLKKINPVLIQRYKTLLV